MSEMSEIDIHKENDFIPNTKEDKNTDIDPCPICLDEMTADVHTTCCGHKFHGKCLNSSITKCPICRKRLDVSLSKIYGDDFYNMCIGYNNFRLLMGMEPLAYTD